ncbi:hypothetical protein ACQQ97_07640 [Anaerovoracaceae bacterium SGI.195]
MTAELLTTIITLVIGFITIAGYIKKWLENFEKRIEAKYQARIDDESEHTALLELKERLEELMKRLDASNDHLRDNSDGTLALLRYRLKEETTLALERGYTTLGEYEVITEMYRAYKNLGGNHTVEHMFEDYHELPMK